LIELSMITNQQKINDRDVSLAAVEAYEQSLEDSRK